MYYLSRIMTPTEQRYPKTDRLCLALVFAAKKLRQTMMAHTVHLRTKEDPVKYLLSQPALSRRAARWLLMLSEYDIQCVSQKSSKGQALADLLAENPVRAKGPIETSLPDEHVLTLEDLPKWTLYFDGSAAAGLGGIGFNGSSKYVFMFLLQARFCLY